MIQGLNDKRAILQCIGCIIQNPSLLEDYPLEKEDFSVEAFHEIVFACIYNLYNKGVEVIDCFAIDSFLSNYEKQYKIFNDKDNNGINYINDAIALCEPANFQYNYKRLKKFSYLRFLERQGFDTRVLYDSTVVEPVAQEKEMAKLDNTSIDDMIDLVDSMLVAEARLRYSSSFVSRGQLAGKGMKELKEKLKEAPEMGIPLQSKIMNTIARGSRLKKVYLRSSDSGGGKTRLAIGDMCCYSIPWFYDYKKGWVHTGFSEPSLFISTELEEDEIQTIIMAYISGVNEGHILDGEYEEGEEERVDQAIEYIKSAPFYIEFMPDFDIKDIENIIKKYKREKGVKYVSFDYIHTSIKLLTEISSVSKGVRMREDQVLFLLMDRLKNMANTLGVHIDTSTQVTGEYKDVKEKDNRILRGAKSLSDRVDLGVISLQPSQSELEGIKPILAKMVASKTPNLIQHVYKVRRGKLTKVRVWQYVDLGTCRVEDLFVTTNDFKLIPVEKTTIENIDEIIKEHSIDEKDVEVDESEINTEALFTW